MAVATKKVLYFTAGPVPTGPELTAIDQLNALVGSNYAVGVRDGSQSPNYGAGPEAADFVAGTPPEGYADTEDYPRITPATADPAGALNKKTITSGVAIAGVTLAGTAGAGKSMVLTIVNNVVTTATFT